MDTIQNQLRNISNTLLSPQANLTSLIPTAMELIQFFEENSKFQIQENIYEGKIMLPTGFAVSPSQAALCIRELSRTAGFIRGVNNAIQTSLEKNESLPIQVLYAGCGPYALLALPLMSIFSAQEVRFTLIDINKESLFHAQELVKELGYQDFVTEYVLADASEYQIPPNKTPNVIVSETMNVCLGKEPQVSVMRNLLGQVPTAIFVPKSVTVKAALVNPTKEFFALPSDHTGEIPKAERDRLELGTIFQLNAQSIKEWDSEEENFLPAATITIPAYDRNRYELTLLTQVDIDDENILKCHNSSLTQPQPLRLPETFCNGGELSFCYRLGAKPELAYTFLLSGHPRSGQLVGIEENLSTTLQDIRDSMVKTKWLKLPFKFDVEKLKGDLEKIQPDEWQNHMSGEAYKKRMRCVPLYSVDVRNDTIYGFDADANYLPSPILNRCHYFKEVIDRLKCEKAGVSLMSLAAGEEIALHADRNAAYDSGVIRIHVPIQTTPQLVFTVNGEQLHFSEGDCWYLNASCMHGVQNPSELDSVHLIIDCRKNEWLENLFKEAGFLHDAHPKYGDPTITDHNVHEIIAALEGVGSEIGVKMAAELQRIAAS